jgi:hypothetical protein
MKPAERQAVTSKVVALVLRVLEERDTKRLEGAERTRFDDECSYDGN